MSDLYNTRTEIYSIIFWKGKTEVFVMIESRCGILCGAWGYREQMGYKACCEEKGQEHCGQRGEFSCALLGQFAYDEKQGDGGRRIEQCRCWAKY